MNAEKIKNLIYETLDEDKNSHNVLSEKTRILNIEHSIGEYHAYMKILSDLDINKFVEVYHDTSQRIDEMMKFVENIYK